jgi:uncharacterized DUF497 family protein
MAEVLREISGFEWDEGSSGKNEAKHGVTDRESEEIFFNKPLIVARSPKGSREFRYVALGKTYGSRVLTVRIYHVRQQDSCNQRPADEQKREESV